MKTPKYQHFKPTPNEIKELNFMCCYKRVLGQKTELTVKSSKVRNGQKKRKRRKRRSRRRRRIGRRRVRMRRGGGGGGGGEEEDKRVLFQPRRIMLRLTVRH